MKGFDRISASARFAAEAPPTALDEYMAIQIGAKPDSGYDDPLGMLQDCHRRIERFLGILCMVADRASDRQLQPEERAAVEAALQYFREGGVRHNADEEESLFPRLRNHNQDSESSDIAQLEDDHRRTSLLHHQVDEIYHDWIAAGALTSVTQQKLLSATEELRSIYAAHILFEESVVFPRAARVLDRAAIAAIGSEFKARRS